MGAATAAAAAAAAAAPTTLAVATMVGQSPWLPLSGLPAKKLVVSCARFCGLGRSAIWSKRGRPAHLAQRADTKSVPNDTFFG